MRFLKSGFFMNPQYLLPRFTPLNIFENIFVFAEIFTKVVFFQSNFLVTIPGNCTISRYCYPKVALKKYYFREYLGENQNIFEDILGCESRKQVLWIHEKNQTSKISCYCPFKAFINHIKQFLSNIYFTILYIVLHNNMSFKFSAQIHCLIYFLSLFYFPLPSYLPSTNEKEIKNFQPIF